jgi:hypothetical protein
MAFHDGGSVMAGVGARVRSRSSRTRQVVLIGVTRHAFVVKSAVYFALGGELPGELDT